MFDQIEFVPFTSRFLAPEFDFTPHDFGEFKQAMTAAFPSEKQNLERYFSAVEPMVRSMRH